MLSIYYLLIVFCTVELLCFYCACTAPVVYYVGRHKLLVGWLVGWLVVVVVVDVLKQYSIKSFAHLLSRGVAR